VAFQSQSTSRLAAAVSEVRLYLDDAATLPKWTDSRILKVMSDIWSQVLVDVMNHAANPVVASYNFTLTSGQRRYPLPCNVGEVLRVAKYTDNVMDWEWFPLSQYNAYGYGFRFDGTSALEAQYAPSATGDVVTVEYVPSGDVALVSGTIAKTAATTTTLTLGGATVTLGNLDQRPNAWLGCAVNVFKSAESDGTLRVPSGFTLFPIQERIVASQASATSTITLASPLDFDPSALASAALLHFEVYPLEAPSVWPAIILRTAARIAMIEEKTRKQQALLAEYQGAVRAAVLKSANFQTRIGKSSGQPGNLSGDTSVWSM
jgi:hypothetical protein